MKKTLYPVLTAISLVVLTACSNEPSAKEKPAEEKSGASAPVRASHVEENTMVRVPLTEAMGNVARYDSVSSAVFGSMGAAVPLKAYTVHAADLFESLGMPASYVDSAVCVYHHVRVYLGLDSANNFKLYFTPVTGASLSDSRPSAGTDYFLTDERGMRYVMDLNAPCPNTCDVTSPLYNPNSAAK
jgi:hypothetical protein